MVAAEVSRDFTPPSGSGVGGLGGVVAARLLDGRRTFTGSRRVSNSCRRFGSPGADGKKAMLYMALSCRSSPGDPAELPPLQVGHVPGKTLNAVLFERVVGDLWSGSTGKVVLAIVLGSETALLFVAAQTGIIDGPQVLSNMALDYSLRGASPISRSASSGNTAWFHGRHGAPDALHSGGSIQYLVIMYSINVFLTFSFPVRDGPALVEGPEDGETVEVRSDHERRRIPCDRDGALRHRPVQVRRGGVGDTPHHRFFVSVSLLIRRHYRQAQENLKRLDDLLLALPPVTVAQEPMVRRQAQTAVIMVSAITAGDARLLLRRQAVPGMFRNFVFISRGSSTRASSRGPRRWRTGAQPEGPAAELRGVCERARLLR